MEKKVEPVRVILIMLLMALSPSARSQQVAMDKAKQEVKAEMERFYDKMRAIDLSWMDILSDDATAVHNGEFMAHEPFVTAERNFFNSLAKLEITLLTEPVYYVLGPDAVLVTQKHSVTSTTKQGVVDKDWRQFLTFVWHRRNGAWKLVFSHFDSAK